MFTSFADIRATITRNFLTGLFVLIPLVVLFYVTRWMLQWVGGVVRWLPGFLSPDDKYLPGVEMLFSFAVFLVVCFLIVILGWLSKRYLGKKILSVVRELLRRIPILGAIYSAIDQLMQTLGSDASRQFRRVVYIEYPRKDVWAIAFVTGKATGTAPEDHLNIFIPTVPNPTSGFHLIMPEKDVRESGLSVEEAFRTIISLGMAQGKKS